MFKDFFSSTRNRKVIILTLMPSIVSIAVTSTLSCSRYSVCLIALRLRRNVPKAPEPVSRSRSVSWNTKIDSSICLGFELEPAIGLVHPPALPGGFIIQFMVSSDTIVIRPPKKAISLQVLRTFLFRPTVSIRDILYSAYGNSFKSIIRPLSGRVFNPGELQKYTQRFDIVLNRETLLFM